MQMDDRLFRMRNMQVCENTNGIEKKKKKEKKKKTHVTSRNIHNNLVH